MKTVWKRSIFVRSFFKALRPTYLYGSPAWHHWVVLACVSFRDVRMSDLRVVRFSIYWCKRNMVFMWLT